MNTTVLAVGLGALAVVAIAMTKKEKPATRINIGINPSDLKARSPGQPPMVRYTGQFQPITPPQPPQQSHPPQY